MGALISINPPVVREDIINGIIPRRRGRDSPCVISLDGNIGAGKSTLLEKIGTAFPHIKVVPEPVDTWTRLKNKEGRNLLELFYEDKRRWAYTFQNAAILSRLKTLKDALSEAGPGQIIVTERSVLTDRFVFAQMLRTKGRLTRLNGTCMKCGIIISHLICLWPESSILQLASRLRPNESRRGDEEAKREFLMPT